MKLTLTEDDGKVIKTFDLAPYIVAHPYPGGAGEIRQLVHNRFMGDLNAVLAKRQKGMDPYRS